MNIWLLYQCIKDTRIPLYIKILTVAIIAYIVSPIDIIPDFIPVLGLLDEAILLPICLALVASLIPAAIQSEYKQMPVFATGERQRLANTGIIIVVIVWLAFTGLALYYLLPA